jgi:putative phosphoribosyl transferase
MYSEAVRIRCGEIDMEGVLSLPRAAIGVVIVFGSDSNRMKPPGDYVVSALRSTCLGTLWLDLPVPEAACSRHSRADAGMLAQRLDAACEWLTHHEQTGELPLGLFGTGCSASAALQLVAVPGNRIAAMVLRGARPDPSTRLIAGKIHVPTLLIVGGLDFPSVELNRVTFAALRCKKRLEIIPGATRSFDEPGSPEVVARLARAWFQQHTTACA